MKKFLRPPEHWQDFETLCKKLFGEMLGCPYTIKQNGRLGQPQSGVDIYGKPKNENFYWCIQCKGKDNYSNAQLTENEIDAEIERAKSFEPELKVFVIATTAPKDATIEKIVRIRDKKSVEDGGFEILLYAWQDLSDLIVQHRDTFNWFVNNIQFKDEFDVEVSFAGEGTSMQGSPTFLKAISRYEYVEPKLFALHRESQDLIPSWAQQPPVRLFNKQVNHAWVEFQITIKNTGSRVIEDWKLLLQFPETVKQVKDDFRHNVFNYKEMLPYRTTWADADDKSIVYKPLKNAPLIQKDSKSFDSYVLPGLNNDEEIKIKWKLLARDYDKEGELLIVLNPQYKEQIDRIPVASNDEVRNEEKISYYITN